MWLLTSRFCADMQPAGACLAWSSIFAARGHIVWPANAFAVCGFQSFADEFLGNVWASSTFLALSFALSLGSQCAFGGRGRLLERVLMLALVGRWLGSSFGR